MRIVGGTLGGRTFDSPSGHRTHPMSEKIRGAIFNMLGDINGLTVLDAFAGSGALGFEAISRGAKQATLIETDKTAHSQIIKNIESLGLDDDIKAIKANISSWSDNNALSMFDLVFLDPPYDDVRPDLLEKLAKHCKDGGLMILSLPPRLEFSPLAINFQLLASKDYGDASIKIYKKLSS